MDTIAKLNELAFGSRLARISNTLMNEAGEIYAYNQVDFQPKWFPTFHFLKDIYPQAAAVTDIAAGTGVSHPLINRFVNELIKAGLAREKSDPKDKRKRLIALSKKGYGLAGRLEPIWTEMELSIRDIICSVDPGLLDRLTNLEERLRETGFLATYKARTRQAQYHALHIRINDEFDFEAFQAVNLEWLNKYFGVEPHDKVVLGNPQKIIDDGGFIISASLTDEAAGACTLLKLDNEGFELSKMGVFEKDQGKQIGRRLLDEAIKLARKQGAKRLYLETNNRLKPAIELYRRAGFTFTTGSHTGESAYARANVFMKLELGGD